jgi:hypothetical protein
MVSYRVIAAAALVGRGAWWRSSLLAAGASVACLLIFTPEPARGEEAAYRSAPALGARELAELRGGFVTVGGLEINFGLEVQSFVDGAPVLQTALTSGLDGGGLGLLAGPVGLDPAGSPGFGGGDGRWSVGDAAATQVVHAIDRGHLSFVTNRADDRLIQQVTTVNIEVANFRTFAEQLLGPEAVRLSDLLGDSVTRSLTP